MEVRFLPPELPGPGTLAPWPGQRNSERVAEIACPSCGTSNPETARFCGSCGEVLERTCPSCGTANPLANRFCGSCGTALVPVQERPSERAANLEERKVVTMLFADLTASTEMSSRLDPEDLRSVLRPFFDAMADEIGRYGGTVEKFIGDAVVAAFGAPVAHEDDPERAIRCGLAMQRRLAELNTEVAELAGSDLAMRIGINTGEVLAHSIEEGIVTGEAVNIAARLQSLASPGRVVVGERTYRDAREAFAFADLGDVSVKGIERPLRVYEVEREAAGTDEGRERATAPLVGRDPEMELLRLQFRRTVAQSNPNLITIVGPPGIGKSRLCDEAARAFEDEGAQRRPRAMPAVRRRADLLAPGRDPAGRRRDLGQRPGRGDDREGARASRPEVPRRGGDGRRERPAVLDRRRARHRSAARVPNARPRSG